MENGRCPACFETMMLPLDMDNGEPYQLKSPHAVRVTPLVFDVTLDLPGEKDGQS